MALFLFAILNMTIPGMPLGIFDAKKTIVLKNK